MLNSPVFSANRRPVERIESVDVQVIGSSSAMTTVKFIANRADLLVHVESRAAGRSEQGFRREMSLCNFSAPFSCVEMPQHCEGTLACTHLAVTQALSLHLHLSIHSTPRLHLLSYFS